MKTQLRRRSGFTLVEVMIVVSVIGLLTAVAVPNFVKARETSHQKICVSNIKQIEAAISTWALDTGKGSGSPIVSGDLFGSTKYIRLEPKCPAVDQVYTLAASVGDSPPVTCPSGIVDHKLQ